MTSIDFVKYHGTGNDFILIDDRKGELRLSGEEIAMLCHRRLGIGADGLILLRSSVDHDFEMKYFNSDGKEGTMCGNGGRCATAFASGLGIVKNVARFSASDGIHKAIIHNGDGIYSLIEISLASPRDIKKVDDATFVLDTGSPHFVRFVPDLEAVDAYADGKRIRWDEKFSPDGINVNFVQKTRDRLKVKTFERGVEDLTLSCGTGVTACALAASTDMNSGPFTWYITTPGGDLTVSFEKKKGQFFDIWLKGPAEKVFAGSTMR